MFLINLMQKKIESNIPTILNKKIFITRPISVSILGICSTLLALLCIFLLTDDSLQGYPEPTIDLQYPLIYLTHLVSHLKLI